MTHEEKQQRMTARNNRCRGVHSAVVPDATTDGKRRRSKKSVFGDQHLKKNLPPGTSW